MSQSEKSFTVSDRRHFTAEGRPREDDSKPEEPTAAPDAAVPGTEAPVDFSHFVMGLAAEAGRLMAGGEGGEAPSETLTGARQIVGILEMLKDKTEGRRTADEDALLAELLFQLRMAYIERTRAGKP